MDTDTKDTETEDTDTKDTDTKNTVTMDTDTKDTDTEDTDTKDTDTKNTVTMDTDTNLKTEVDSQLQRKFEVPYEDLVLAGPSSPLRCAPDEGRPSPQRPS